MHSSALPIIISQTHNKLTKQVKIHDLGIAITAFNTANEVTESINAQLNKHSYPTLNKPIDGIGLQLKFEVNGNEYLIAGINMGEVLSVMGGQADSTTLPVFHQLKIECEEESFNVFQLTEENGQIFLNCAYLNKKIPLQFNTIHINDHADWKMSYLTMSASVTGFSLDELKNIAAYLTPTAKFWNPIGNFLHAHRRIAASKTDEEFMQAWQNPDMIQKRANLITTLNTLHLELIKNNPTNSLLVDLPHVFGGNNFAEGLQKFSEEFNNLSTKSAFWDFKNNKVGSYSERPGFHVVAAQEMKAALIDKRKVNDIDNTPLGEVFDSLAVGALCQDNVTRYHHPYAGELANLIREGSIDIIFDHDGVLMHSDNAEATRIAGILNDILPIGLVRPTPEAILKIGYGKNGVWADELLQRLAANDTYLYRYFKTNSEKLEEIKKKIAPDMIDDSIIRMGLDLKELPGAGEFLKELLKLNDTGIAVFSGNWNETVYVALNTHLTKYGISCAAPRHQTLHPLASQLIPTLATELKIAVFNDSYNRKLRYKPYPDGLLAQKYALLEKRQIVIGDQQLDHFMPGLKFNHPDYRKTAYIGDDLSDLEAACNAGFEFFVGINATNSISRQKMLAFISERAPAIKVIFAENLQELHQLLFKPEKKIIPDKGFGNVVMGTFGQSNTITPATPIPSLSLKVEHK